MKQLDKTNTNKPKAPRSAVNLLFMTILDTTWRAFVPTIGGAILGIMLDNIFKTAPTITSVMIILGFVTSGLLIALQIRSVRRLR